MGFLYSIVPLIQIVTAVHVIKTGRSWFWLWIILLFPLVGSAIYFIIEVLPDLRRGGSGDVVDRALNALQPERELKQLQEQLDIADTIENRRALADYYLRVDQPQKAIELYKSCLRGVFQNDPETTLALCSALVAAQLYDEAKTTLEELRTRAPSVEPSKRELLYARTLEGLGQESEAMSVYESLVDKYSSEVEAGCRLAQLAEKAGQTERAKLLYEDILKRAKRFAPHHRKSQQRWITLAQEGVKNLSRPRPCIRGDAR
jgi:hypothetical protein